MQTRSKGVQGLLAIDHEINAIVRRRNRAARNQEQFSEEMASPSRMEHTEGITAETIRSAGLSAPQNRSPLRGVDENEEQPLQRERDQPLRPTPNVEQYQDRDPYYEQPDDRAGFYEREDQFEPRRRNAPREDFFEPRGREVPRNDYYEPRRMNAPRENYRGYMRGERREERRTIADFMTPEFSMHNSIYIPPVEANNFDIKPSVITLVQNAPFSGLPSEDPHGHITRFVRSCGMYRQNGVPEEVVRLKLFPFSVIGDAARWLDSHANNHFRSWEQLHKEFMQEFFPLTKTLKIRKQVQDFKQGSMESLGEAWRRFKALKRQCPPDVFHPWDVISSFYGGLNDENKMLLDSSSKGAFVSSLPEDAEELIETISANTSCWYNKRDSKSGLYEVSNNTASDARVEAMGHEIRRLQARIEKMGKQPQEGNPCMSLALYCDICGGPHGTQECTSTYDDPGCEQVSAVGYQRPQNFNSYGNNNQGGNWRQGQGWQQHPNQNQGWQNQRQGGNQGGNSSYNTYRGNSNIQIPPQREGPYRPPPTQRVGGYPPRDEPPRENFEEKMIRMMSEIKQDMGHMRQEWKQDIRQEVSAVRQEVSNYRQESTSSIRNLETQ